MLLCGICQTETNDDAHHCPNCGEASWVNAPAAKPKRGAKPKFASTEVVDALAEGSTVTPDLSTAMPEPLDLTDEERSTLPALGGADANGPDVMGSMASPHTDLAPETPVTHGAPEAAPGGDPPSKE